MLREILSGRGLVFGVLFCFITVVGSLLYFHHVKLQVEAEFPETERASQNVADTVHTVHPVQQGTVETDDLSSPALQSVRETSVPEIEVTELHSGTGDQDESMEMADMFMVATDAPVDVRVSRFGLGVYPEIPADYPDQDLWDRLEDITDPTHGKQIELIDRVRIKLWKDGIKTVGGSYSAVTHLVYPTIPNVAYVQWDYVDEPDGTRSRYASRVAGGPGPAADVYFDKGEVPPGITVIPYAEAGIDPYTFLEFEYR